MDFTREPVIETIITPREGHKIVVRSSKAAGHEEYFVDAVEVVSFGHAIFLRSKERPKPFLVPASDYEVLEVRETRMVLKSAGVDRASIKIGGGREHPAPKVYKEDVVEREEPVVQEGSDVEASEQGDGRTDRRRDRRRTQRRRRGKDEAPRANEEGAEDVEGEAKAESSGEAKPVPDATQELKEPRPVPSGNIFSSLLPPPPTLISETIARYKDNALFSSAFYTREEKVVVEEPSEDLLVDVEEAGEENSQANSVSESVPEVATESVPEQTPVSKEEEFEEEKPYNPFYEP